MQCNAIKTIESWVSEKRTAHLTGDCRPDQPEQLPRVQKKESSCREGDPWEHGGSNKEDLKTEQSSESTVDNEGKVWEDSRERGGGGGGGGGEVRSRGRTKKE